jgi:hypothetical protein
MSVIEKRVNRTISISAVITRADGTVEDLGIVFSNKPLFSRVLSHIKKYMGRK